MKSEATLPIKPVLAGVSAAGACWGWEGVEKDDPVKLEPEALLCCCGCPPLAC